MKYQMAIEGMHCQGCATLIKISLEETGFEQVNVDLEKKLATFVDKHAEPSDIIEKKVRELFIDLEGYSYSDFKQV